MDRFIRLTTHLLCSLLLPAGAACAADINREWVDFTPPAEIKWVKNPNRSNESAILFGDPSKAEPCVVRINWHSGKATSTPAEEK